MSRYEDDVWSNLGFVAWIAFLILAALMLSGCGGIGHAERCANVWCGK